jgi:RimJ/RimL family protein N-acetyltransferase
MIEVREVTVQDAESVTALLTRLVHEKPPVALELEPLIMKGRAWIADFPTGNMGIFVVAAEQDTIIGFCYMAVPKFYKPVAYIGIAVDKNYRRHNIGQRMFYHAAEWASTQQIQYIIADVWSWNTKSVQFFERLGFVFKESFRDNYKGQDKVKARLILKL